MSALSVGWYNPKLKIITNIEPWNDKPETITFTSLMLAQLYQTGSKGSMPSSIWIAFDMAKILRVFSLNNTLPGQKDLERIEALVIDIRNGGGVECVF